MIQRYRFGDMYPTDSVVLDLPVSDAPVPYLEPVAGGFRYEMPDDMAVYGLGETVRGINKRGWHYASFCTDDPNHLETKQALYAAHNFLIFSGSEALFGVFVDFAGRVEYDLGYTCYSCAKIAVAEDNYDLYIITGDSLKDVAKQFRRLIGRSYIPPKWAFGYGQSRWGYKSEADVRAVAEQYRALDLPLDHIYLDIDYMQNFADFTVNRERFPDLKALSSDLKAQGIRLAPIIDAGIRVDPDSEICREGLEKDYFCKRADGKPFKAAVWPGLSYFTDYLKPEARAWFGRHYRFLTDMGIEAFWSDMNEPALFYTEEALDDALEALKGNKALPADSPAGAFDVAPEMTPLLPIQHYLGAMHDADRMYSSFYHETDRGRIRHDRVHNLYGYNMMRGVSQGLRELRPGLRTLVFSRASLIGSHRDGGIWLGDNKSWWSHLKLNIRQMPGAQMCGYLFCGADLGGFGEDTTPDLVLRWLAFGVFTPLMRNHAAFRTREQELYRFPEFLDQFRSLLKLRYALIPYLYSEFMKAALEDESYFRPLAFDYPDDPIAREVEDQLLLGESIMIAPVEEANVTGRNVYLPERMKLIRFRGEDDWDEAILEKGHHYLRCRLGEVLVFIRPGRLLPLGRSALCVDDLDDDPAKLKLLAGPDSASATYRLYLDDGVHTPDDDPSNWHTLKL